MKLKNLNYFVNLRLILHIRMANLFVIDESFLIDNIKPPNHQHEIIRFAIITKKDILKVIEAKKNNKYSIAAEFKDTFSLFGCVKLDCFFENMIIVRMEKEYGESVASIYDIGK